jgi:hypothetical protein
MTIRKAAVLIGAGGAASIAAIIVAVVLALACLICTLPVVMFGGAYYIDKASCDATTRDIGFPHRYDFLGGCQIEIKPGQWVPVEAFYVQRPTQ